MEQQLELSGVFILLLCELGLNFTELQFSHCLRRIISDFHINLKEWCED